jgi:hypothetical protein
MTNNQNLLGSRARSATLVRTSVVLVVVGIVLAIVGALTELWGLAIVGGVALGIGVVVGVIGAVVSSTRR